MNWRPHLALNDALKLKGNFHVAPHPLPSYIITSSGVVTDTPEDPRYGADARWQMIEKTFKATPREQLETHSETHSETRTRPALRLFGHADK